MSPGHARNIRCGNFLKPTGKMHMESTSLKKKVALLGIPDDALDVLTHYTQGTDWETVVVVSTSADAYAARMAEVLGIPVEDSVDPEQLVGCDLVVVGPDAGVDVETIREILKYEPCLVADLDEVSRELSFHPFAEHEAEASEIELEGFGAAFEALQAEDAPEDIEPEDAFVPDERLVEDDAVLAEEAFASDETYANDTHTNHEPFDSALHEELEDEDHIVETFGDDPDARTAPTAPTARTAPSVRTAPTVPAAAPEPVIEPIADSRIDIHGSHSVQDLPPALREVRKKHRDSNPIPTRPARPRTIAPTDRTLFDLSGCLGQDPERHFVAVLFDGDSKEFTALLGVVLVA